MISYSSIAIGVLAGRGVNEHLARWAQQFGLFSSFTESPAIGKMDRRHIPDYRNEILRWFRDETDKPWLIVMDDDSVPVDGTLALVLSPADITGPRIVGRSGQEAHPHCLSAAAIKLSRKAVETIAEPWFKYPKGGGCECSYFFNKAYQSGFRPATAGIVGHRFPVVVVPGRDGPEFILDSELRRRGDATQMRESNAG